MSTRRTIEPWFTAENSASATIDLQRASGNWEKLANTLGILCDARQSIAQIARNSNPVQLIHDMEFAESIREDGRYLVTPPLVARDASILDHALKSKGISAIVLCREPTTQLKLCPIVALGSGVTIRVQIDEPDNPEKPLCGWFDNAVESLGAAVLSKLDTETSFSRQLNFLLVHISAVPSCVDVYQAAIKLCNTLTSESV